jgi:hypothetical protein
MYYTARVQMEFETDKGHVKKKTETYLVKAESVTDAEAIVHEKFKNSTFEFEVKAVSQSRICDVYSAAKD